MILPASPALVIGFPDPPRDATLADRIAVALDEFPVTAIDEGVCPPDDPDRPPARWAVHFAEAGARDRALRVLLERFSPAGVSCEAVDVQDEAWAVRSQASLHAVTVGQLVIAPPWDHPAADPASVVVIEPSTGFGTGHHATTRLCLRALQAIDVTGQSVLDLGTGSGVLAIAAARRGAAHVVGLDRDPDALASARRNVALNDVGDRVALHLADLEDAARLALAPAAVVVANLTAGALRRHAATIRALAAAGGRLVLGGVLVDQADDVVAAFDAGGPWRLVSRETEEEWVALVLRND